MLNQYPLWKYLLLAVILLTGAVFSMPNLYGEDPALQISHRTRDVAPDDVTSIESSLKTLAIEYKQVELEKDKILVRFNSEEAQLGAVEQLKETLDKGFLVALNLAPATPDWLDMLSAAPMYLGLDLRGGVHFRWRSTWLPRSSACRKP